jgi:hypothetical protein
LCFIKNKKNQGIDGILYPSSICDGKCCVLFINQDNIIDKQENFILEKAVLELIGYNIYKRFEA